MLRITIILSALIIIACNPQKKEATETSFLKSQEEIKDYLTQYEPYEMTFDGRDFSDTDKLILQKLVKAAEYMDTAYWMQTSKVGLRLIDSLSQIEGDPYAADLHTLLQRNGGPFELLNEYEPFIGTQEYYGGDEMYPRGMTAEQFDVYVERLSEEEKAAFMYPYTVIREDGKGGYKAIRFYEEYKTYIDPIVTLLNEAADLSDNESFANFLRLKATALTTDNYFDADIAWIDMSGSKFDIVFGPFETYEDQIKGVKAKYEAYIEIIDQEASADLEKYTAYLQEMEKNLPIPEEYKSVVDGLTANFTVVRDIIRKGDGRIGYQAVATNLPNDPAVHKAKGTKKTFWKNMFEARFNAIIKPVSNILIDESQLQYLSDDGFFKFVLLHEICHAIGPREVKTGPKKGMAANAAIGPNYSPLEEAKADIVGLYSLAYLMDQGVEDSARANEFYVSFLGSLFRSIRFGLDEAHGKAAAISLSYLLENGGILYNAETKKWSIDFENFEAGVKMLATEMLILEGDGDNLKVQAFFDKWTAETPMLAEAMELTSDIAIDVLPIRKIIWE
ncbi:MAG: hypothetical protein ACJA08_001857 [Cyclobacteriaceae bacterium]|jgi:hypothetical protein